MFKRVLALILGLVLLPSAERLAAQSVLVRAVDEATSTPLFGALAYLTTPDGATVRNALTDERGRALFVGLEPGEYRLRVEMIGMATGTTEPFPVAGEETVSRELRLASSAIELEGISVEAENDRCRVRSEQAGAVVGVWDEARKALSAAVFTERERVYRYRTVLYERELERESRAIRSEERRESGGYQRTPFESRPAADLIENGFVQATGDGDNLYFAPDAHVLLSDEFMTTHCLRLRVGEGAEEGLVGLVFEPVTDRRSTPDITGTLWLDAETAELDRMEFAYVNIDPAISSPDVGGRVEFRRLPDGTWIIPEWSIRMPEVGVLRDFRGQPTLVVNGYREVGGVVQQVQEAGGRTVMEAETATIEGVVLDSLGADPVRGARVGLMGSPQRVFTDAEGRFRIPGLTDGVYQLVYTHPALEAVGYQPEAIEQEVAGGDVVSVRIVMPAVGSVAGAMCPADEDAQGAGIVIGTVRGRGSGRPLVDAAVQVEWPRFDQGVPGQLPTDVRIDGYRTRTDPDGRYRLCHLPENRPLTVFVLYEDRESRPDTLRIMRPGGVVVHDIGVPIARR